MSSGITGTYEGEGPNVSATLKTVTIPDVGGKGNNTTTGQGAQVGATMTRRRQLRVSSEGARAAIAINYGGGDQTLTNYSRGVYITTSGTLVVRLADDTADATFSGLLAGQWYPLCISIIRQTSSTAAGLLLM